MRKLLTLILILLSINSYSQIYISFSGEGTNTPGSMRDRANIAIEIGKQYNEVFTAGIDFGKTTLSRVSHKDTSNYLEFRPNLNIFQQTTLHSHSITTYVFCCLFSSTYVSKK